MCNRYILFLLTALAWGQNQQTSPLVVLPFQATPVTGGDIKVLSPNYIDYGEILSTANAFEIIGKQTTNGNITLMPGNVAGGNLASTVAIGPRSDTPTLQVISGYSPFNSINFQDLNAFALAANTANQYVWRLGQQPSNTAGILKLGHGATSGGVDSQGSSVFCADSALTVGGFAGICEVPNLAVTTTGGTASWTTMTPTSLTMTNNTSLPVWFQQVDSNQNGLLHIANSGGTVRIFLDIDALPGSGDITVGSAAVGVSFSASDTAANGNPGALVSHTLSVTGPGTSSGIPAIWATQGDSTLGTIAVTNASFVEAVGIGLDPIGNGFIRINENTTTTPIISLGADTSNHGTIHIRTSGNVEYANFDFNPIANTGAMLTMFTGAQPVVFLGYSITLAQGDLSLQNSLGATVFDAAAGITHTATVRNSAGTGTCTLIFLYGLLNGGTC